MSHDFSDILGGFRKLLDILLDLVDSPQGGGQFLDLDNLHFGCTLLDNSLRSINPPFSVDQHLYLSIHLHSNFIISRMVINGDLSELFLFVG